MYVFVGMCVPVDTGSRGGWKKASVPFKLESWSFGSYPPWVLGAEPQFSEEVASTQPLSHLPALGILPSWLFVLVLMFGVDQNPHPNMLSR